MTIIKKHFYTIATSIALSTIITASTQAQESNSQLEQIVTKVDTKANYPGGMMAFYKQLNNTLDTKAMNLDKEIKTIKTFLSFNVEVDGSLTDIKITKGELGGIADKILIETLINAGKWQPALLDEKPVKSNFILLISKSIE